jgi:hypothetical protein
VEVGEILPKMGVVGGVIERVSCLDWDSRLGRTMAAAVFARVKARGTNCLFGGIPTSNVAFVGEILLSVLISIL